LRDATAVAAASNIEFDFTVFRDSSAISACILRAFTIDTIVNIYLEKSPQTTVLNLGSGLDTRYYRLKTSAYQWIELDFPSVIDLRLRLLPHDTSHMVVASSVLDFEWMASIRSPSKPLIIASGLLIYLPRFRAAELLEHLSQAFPSSIMILDILKPWAASAVAREIGVTFAESSGRSTNNFLHLNEEPVWGITAPDELEQWGNAKVLKSWSYMLSPQMPGKNRNRQFAAQFMSTTTFSSLVVLQLL